LESFFWLYVNTLWMKGLLLLEYDWFWIHVRVEALTVILYQTTQFHIAEGSTFRFCNSILAFEYCVVEWQVCYLINRRISKIMTHKDERSFYLPFLINSIILVLGFEVMVVVKQNFSYCFETFLILGILNWYMHLFPCWHFLRILLMEEWTLNKVEECG
jgi:hypothetical protein